jgi:uncharacterized SAM-binding protein YcdF (DUF218 family)
MFSSKYVFESKHTRTRRLFRNLFLTCLVLSITFSLLCVYLPIYAQNQEELTKLAFFKKSPDVIAVYTGDSGRLDYTFKKIESSPSVKVFISGVYSKNNLKTLLDKQGRGISVEEFMEQESHHVDIEYQARNTFENGIATFNYLRRLDGLKNILVISSDYHILRISLILNRLKSEDDNYNFFYESIPSDYSQTRNLKKLFKEVYKLIRTSAFLLFWND